MELKIVPLDTILLTERDVEMVRMLSDGNRATEIGDKLELSNRTVEANILLLKRRTNCRTIPQLVALFIRNKIID